VIRRVLYHQTDLCVERAALPSAAILFLQHSY
jgi:hypothetical protein